MKEETNRSRLYHEFAVFYMAHRCGHAPENPRRVFNLAFDAIYEPYFRRRMSEEEFLGVIYSTLGFPRWTPPGLFETYDPKKYRGEKSAEDHFVLFFATKLRGNIDEALRRRRGDGGQEGNRDRFVGKPPMGLHHGSTTSETPANQLVRPSDVPEFLDRLTSEEVAVMHLKCWRDLSDREVGKLLALDNKAVCRIRSAVAAKIQRMFGVETFLGI